MQKDPYLILGLNNEATIEEVETAYRTLRKKYSDLRFEEGEIGANASKMLGQIEIAYKDCMDDLKRKNVVNDYGSEYGEIDNLIKENKLEEAQDLLDKFEVRDAAWHYYQAQIYYRRQWHNEAKNQLEIAVDLDPSNEKYKSTLQRLKNKMNANNENANESAKDSTQNTRAGYSKPAGGGMSDSDACCNACSTLICADCCCECMGGDLIPCC